MTHTLRLEATIPDDRRVAFTLPDEVPVGEAEVILVVVSKAERRRSTGKDLLESEAFGMWRDRTDLGDSAEAARELRERAWKRAE